MNPDPQFRAWFNRIRPELEAARDQLAAELAALPIDAGFLWAAYTKARIGWAEHDGGIVHMNDAQLALEERDEVIDLIVYRATRITI